jgi:pSer/pThr/pTyr-binding forkhead associated (FHA) protein
MSIPDRTVSRFHFALLLEEPGGTWIVYDLSSTNGLWLNGRRVRRPVRLRTRDCLMFGRNCIMVVLL